MDVDALRSPLALAILGMLYEEPMHPYRMQQLIKARDKDVVINVRMRTSLYRTIARLEKAGLVAVRETTRSEKRPERTVYELTEAGGEALLRWLREMLATPALEFPEFPAAIAHLPFLSPQDAIRQLERREAALAAEIDDMDQRFREGAEAGLPRMFVIELEYAYAVRQAELSWLRAFIDDLRAGRLTWRAEDLEAYRGQPK